MKCYCNHVLHVIPIEWSLILGNVIKNTNEKVEQLTKLLSARMAKYKGLVHYIVTKFFGSNIHIACIDI